MNELIKITKQGSKDTVNARELHEFLGSKQDFSTWIKNRIEKYGFIEKIDFITVPQNYGTANGGHSIRNEYFLTIDMAKELCMVENNDKGRQARLYFIECEKRLNTPLSLEQMTLLVVEGQKKRIEELEVKVNYLEPKAEYYDTLCSSETALDMSEVAKVLNLKKGNVTLFRILREHKILMDNNEPYQEYVTRGYFKMIEQSYLADKEVKTRLKTIVFQKGIEYIKRFIEKHYPELIRKGA